MITFTEKIAPDTLPSGTPPSVDYTLALTADERSRSRHCFQTANGEELHFNLPRGSVLSDGDVVRSPSGQLVQILAKPEPVLVVSSSNPFLLLRAAYHLGNRHVSLELHSTYLQLSPDPVLKEMLHYLGLDVTEDVRPFHPERGAYHHH
jgi:urease accessory protein